MTRRGSIHVGRLVSTVFVLFLQVHICISTSNSTTSADISPSSATVQAGLHWNHLQVTTVDGDAILQESSGFCAKGHICAILGPSGSGKTTFLSAIGGILSNKAGLQLSGQPYMLLEKDGFPEQILPTHRTRVAWLPQHDAFFPMLTVQETLELAAFLELPTTSKEERQELVQATVDGLGLAKVQHRRVGEDRFATKEGRGLSGGERRRLSIALELLSTPDLFLADEATSGLDASMSEMVMQRIHSLCNKRQIPCFCSLHQPRSSIWRQHIDSLLLLGPSGLVCYSGPRQDAIVYFEELGYPCPPETNPAEFFVDLVSVNTEDPIEAAKDLERIEDLARAFRLRNAPSADEANFDRLKRPSSMSVARSVRDGGGSLTLFLRRCGALFLRSWRQNTRDRRVNAIRFVASSGMAILFSQIYKTVKVGIPVTKSLADRTALLSFGVINMSMMALMKTMDLFAKEKPVIQREQIRNQYSSFEYLLAKVLGEIPLDTGFACVFVTCLKHLTGLRVSWKELAATFSLMTADGASLGFCIGGLTPNAETAMTLGVPVMVVLLVVGVINPSGVNPDNPPPVIVRLLREISPIRFAVEALCVAEFRGMEFQKESRWRRIKSLPKMGALSMVENGDQVLEALGLKDVTYRGVMRRLAVLTGMNLAASWIGLQFHNRSFFQKKTKRRARKSRAGQSQSDTGTGVVETRSRPAEKVTLVRNL